MATIHFLISPIRRLLWMLSMFASAGHLCAHSGHGSEMQVRVFDDKMRIVIRTSIPLAWARMGSGAPALADEEGRKTALPMLVAMAPAMVDVKAGSRIMTPMTADCLFEVGDHVAFVLVFHRPAEWPVELNANFVNTLGQLDMAAVSIFDHSGSRFARDLKPLLEKALGEGDTRVSFSIPSASSPVGAVPPEPPEATPATHSAAPLQSWGGWGKSLVFLLLWVPCVILAWVVLMKRRSSG